MTAELVKDGAKDQTTVQNAIDRKVRTRVKRRELLLHDGLSFLVLSLIALALYGVTLFLFRSFEQHREDLGREYSKRGVEALASGHPEMAVVALRAALSYAPDERPYQMLLAQALAGAGKTEEASNYFLALHEARPGDGFLNLQIARLDRRKGDVSAAVEYYRASIFGDWLADGIVRRREVRLELAEYLQQQDRPTEARVELMTAMSNAPDTEALDLLFAQRLLAAGDLPTSLAEDRKALGKNPNSRPALEQAGRALFGMGQYAAARNMLHRAEEIKPALGAADDAEIAQMEHDASRLTELTLSRELRAHERAEHLQAAAAIAEARLNACAPIAPPAAGTDTRETTGAVQTLRARWKAADDRRVRKQMQVDADTQDSMEQLIFDTERALANPQQLPRAAGQPAATCGAPKGDDALLLHLATTGTGNDGSAQ